MSQSLTRPSRRKFLFAAGTTAGVAGAAAVAATRLTPPTAPVPDVAEKRDGAGYAESAHVRNYYRTTRI